MSHYFFSKIESWIESTEHRCFFPFTFFAAGILVFAILCYSFTAKAEIVEADYIPESGYWWPYKSGGLALGVSYIGHPAPLERFDLLTEHKYPGTQTNWYKNNVYDPDAGSWWGHCLDWALAAIYEEIEILPASVDNIIFRVGDKKGLLTLAHDHDRLTTGDGSQAEVFHEWLLNYLKDQGIAFAADLDSSEEKWNFPIYRYDMTSVVIGNIESVTVTINYAGSLVNPDFMGTHELEKAYTYDLFLDGEGAITGGTWTGGSVIDHPQRMYFPLEQRSWSPDLDYNKVLDIVASRDDFLESSDQTVALGPGTYNLVLMDEDRYQVHSSVGDVISLKVEKQAGSKLDMAAVVTDGEGFEVENVSVSGSNSLDLLLDGQDGPYSIAITQSDYSDPNIYTLRVDMQRTVTQHVPYIPKNGMWSGFALTNPTDSPVEGVMLATFDGDGAPLQTVLGPLDLAPGEKRKFLFDDLAWRAHEYSSSYRLTLFSDPGVSLLNLFGDSNGSLAGFVQGNSRGDRLVLPETIPEMISGRIMFGEVLNESFEAVQVVLRLYNQGGGLVKEVSREIEARGTWLFQPGVEPFYSMPDGGWIEIQGDAGRSLSAFQYLSVSAGPLETIFGLPVGSGNKIVPHVARPAEWTTSVTLINPNDTDNTIILHPDLAGSDTSYDMTVELGPRAKTIIELQDNYGTLPGDPLYHSIINLTGLQPFVGYYSYQSKTSRDDAMLPLIDGSALQKELTLPHSTTANPAWWTGVGIANPTDAPVTVDVRTYDVNGVEIETGTAAGIEIPLPAGAYETFLVRTLLGEGASEVSFINFRVQEEEGAIVGFYLYSNTGAQELSGANMM